MLYNKYSMKNPKTNQNVSSPPDTKSPNIYPSILNMNPGTIYPDLSLSLGSAHMQQNNLSKRTNNQGLSLSISQIKANQSNQPDQERDSHDSVVTKSQKFFRNFKYQKKNQQNLDYSAILNLKMLQDLDQDAKDRKIDKQESAHSRSYNHKQSPVQENKKLSMTQMFMRKFNNSKEKNSQEDPSEQNKKQKTIKISYNQISSSSSNSQQEEQLTNVINKTKQQLKNDQQNKLNTSYSYISDNLQSCNQEPALQAIIPSNKQLEGQQNFKKAIPKFEENVKNQKKQEGQKEQNEEDEEEEEEEEEDEDIFDEESQEQNVKQKMKRINSSDQNQQKIQRNQSQQQVHKNKRIEKKEQLDQNQQVFRQREKQWTSEEQEQSQIEQQQQHEEEQIADKEDDGTVENKKSQIIGFRLYKSLTNQKIKELRQTTETYYPSNYFHAGPRHQMLGFLREIVTQIQHLATGDLSKKSDACVAQIENLMKINTAINILQDLGQKVRLYLKEDVISEILNVISQYNCCNYFHVGPRRQVFSWVLYLISLVEKSRKNITQKNSSKPQGPNGLKGNSNQVEQQQLQKQKEEQQEQEEQEQEQEQQQELEQQQEGQQDENDNDDAEEQEEQEEDDDDQDQDEAKDVINNSIHDLLSNYANNDISFLSTQRSLNIQKREENSVKLSVEEIKNFEIGKKLKQMLTPALIQSLGQTLMQYNSSNYFHVGPRYQLLGFIREYAKFVQRILKNGGTTKIDSNLNDIFLKKSIKMGEEVKKYMTVGKIQQVVSTCQSYDSSNYFHVGPRYSIFGDVRKLISISQL